MEKQEYERIVRVYIDDVFRTALACCRNRSEAEDAVQNTFLKLMTSAPNFTDEEHIRRWLIRVAVNESKNFLKSAWRRNVSYLDELENEPVRDSSRDDGLLDVIGSLPVKYSSVLHLFYYEGYRCSEIAELLHISESNVQTRLMRARNMLKKQLEEA